MVQHLVSSFTRKGEHGAHEQWQGFRALHARQCMTKVQGKQDMLRLLPAGMLIGVAGNVLKQNAISPPPSDPEMATEAERGRCEWAQEAGAVALAHVCAWCLLPSPFAWLPCLRHELAVS